MEHEALFIDEMHESVIAKIKQPSVMLFHGGIICIIVSLTTFIIITFPRFWCLCDMDFTLEIKRATKPYFPFYDFSLLLCASTTNPYLLPVNFATVAKWWQFFILPLPRRIIQVTVYILSPWQPWRYSNEQEYGVLLALCFFPPCFVNAQH